jgi:hypothetical protein
VNHSWAVKRRVVLGAAIAVLVFAGAAAAYGVSTIYLRPGACTTVGKTKVCARKVAPVTVTDSSPTIGKTFKGNGAETLPPITLAHGDEVHWLSKPDSMGFNVFSVYSSPGDTASVSFDNGDSGTSGESYIGPGTYTLSVTASGSWSISF